jgi:DNA invertase Pin-like site-specific DNA recombinase
LRSGSELTGQGYTLTVTRIDRLALSIADLAAIVRELESKGVALKVSVRRQPPCCEGVRREGCDL